MANKKEVKGRGGKIAILKDEIKLLNESANRKNQELNSLSIENDCLCAENERLDKDVQFWFNISLVSSGVAVLLFLIAWLG